MNSIIPSTSVYASFIACAKFLFSLYDNFNLFKALTIGSDFALALLLILASDF